MSLFKDVKAMFSLRENSEVSELRNELKRAKARNASNIRWKEFYRSELEATNWLLLNMEEENIAVRTAAERNEK